MMPSDFPKREIVRYYYDIMDKRTCRRNNTPFISFKKIVCAVRNEGLRKDKTTMGIIDTRSAQNSCTAEDCGYDAGNKISGIKRRIVVDTQGLPRAILVTISNVTDRDGALKMIGCNLENLSNVEKFVVSSGYSGSDFALRMP